MNSDIFNWKLYYLAVFCFLFNLWVSNSSATSQESAYTDIQAAMDQMRSGQNTEAIQKLQAVMEANPDSRPGDKAALMLGNILLQQHRPADALMPLKRAIKGSVGPVYARFLLARAVVEGELQTSYPEAQEQLAYLLQANSEEVTPILTEQSVFLQLKLYFLERRWGEAAKTGKDFLGRWPDSHLVDEARWLTAEALSQAERFQEAYPLYALIWYKTPDSTQALEAKNKLRQLERNRDLAPQRLTLIEQYEFIKALQKVGLHEEALTEIAEFLDRYPQDAKIAEVLLMKVKSLHVLRRNADSIALAEALRQRYPRSPQIAGAAAIYAIKCLRRADNTSEIRRWAKWVINTYPRSSQATEARYELGVHLGNVVSDEEGIEVLQQLVTQSDRQQCLVDNEQCLVDNALWKIAWMQRRLGRTQEAAGTLETLLRDYPSSDFRKAALYWAARFSYAHNPERAVEHYQTLLRDFPNDYYGYQALENLLNLGIQPRQIGNLKPFPQIDSLDHPKDGSDRPKAYFRAVNLKTIGLYNFAAAEIESIPGVESDIALQYGLADLYARFGDTKKAIAILKKHFKHFMIAEPLNPKLEFWQIAYPFHYRSEIEKALKETRLSNNINPYLMAALIRMESLFLPSAISPSGAIGLMQLMPDTVEKMAAQTGFGRVTREQMFDPAINIHFGTIYLAQRVSDFNGTWFPAICSYNAGTEPVRQWLRKKPAGQPQDEFIENIPYLDTRLYIKQILGDYQNYERLYSEGTQ